MADREFLEVDPTNLHLPGGRRDGADLSKLQRQVSRFGRSIAGMPPLEVSRGSDDAFMINDGVTRATRAARYSPGTPITVEVIDELGVPVAELPTIGDVI